MKVKVLVIVLVISTGINLGAIVTFVQHWQLKRRFEEGLPLKPPSWHHSPLGHMLGLSKEQLDAIEKMRKKTHSEIMSREEILRMKRRELMDLLKEPEPVQKRVDDLLKEITNLQVEIEHFIFDDIRQMKGILTPKQEEMFFELFERRLIGGGVSPEMPLGPGHPPKFRHRTPRGR